MVSLRISIIAALLAVRGAFALPSTPSKLPRQSSATPVRGVNLGNHLVIEPWMAPNLISSWVKASGSSVSASSIHDEWTLGQSFDKAWLATQISSHIDSWITDADWAAMRAAKLTHVRMPVPYYMFADLIASSEPYVAADRWNKLKASVLKAKQYGLKVWLSYHAVPGSQNGQDSSGRIGVIDWPSSPDFYNRTFTAWTRIVDEFTQPQYAGTVETIEAVNEPKANTQPEVRTLLQRYLPAANQYLQNATAARNTNVRFAQHDGWLGGAAWSKLYSAAERSKVTMDLHWYYVYGSDFNTSDSTRMKKVCNSAATKLPINMGLYGQTIVGEFSIGAPRGVAVKAARDLPNNTAITFSAEARKLYPLPYLQFLSTNFRLQQQLYEKYANGWMMWAWKLDRNGWREWSFSDGLKYGWIGDLDRNPYGANMCNTLFGM
ncbi:hypothetical protein V8E36_009152 [Tilletia maclaganii]